MATFQEVLSTAISSGQMKMVSVNQNMIEIARETKRKSAFVKTGISEELAKGLMHREKVAFIVHMDADELNRISEEIDQNKLKGDVENAS